MPKDSKFLRPPRELFENKMAQYLGPLDKLIGGSELSEPIKFSLETKQAKDENGDEYDIAIVKPSRPIKKTVWVEVLKNNLTRINLISKKYENFVSPTMAYMLSVTGWRIYTQLCGLDFKKDADFIMSVEYEPVEHNNKGQHDMIKELKLSADKDTETDDVQRIQDILRKLMQGPPPPEEEDEE